jgi:hypothetical protein
MASMTDVLPALFGPAISAKPSLIGTEVSKPRNPEMLIRLICKYCPQYWYGIS